MENTLLQPGAELYQGKFRIIKVIGQGGFGVTYLGIHTGLDKKVAIKEFVKEFDGEFPAKDSIGALDELPDTIPNDLNIVVEELRKIYG